MQKMNAGGVSPRVGTVGTPSAEFQIDSSLVSGLLADQHPDLGHLPLRSVDAGWDNAMFRLGDNLAVRLPRRGVAATLIMHEQAWLPRLAAHLTMTVPAPVRLGTPGKGYPWHWSVVPWLKGITADQHAPEMSQASRLGAFLRSLHIPAPADAPANPMRGVLLRHRAASVEARMRRLATKTRLITPRLIGIWQAALASVIDIPATWIHGDLHPRNILVEEGVISGIIDWGDLTSGDCATDLASIWMLFAESDAHQAALAAYGGLSKATISRAKGWAVLFGVTLLETGLNDYPVHALIGQRILERVRDDNDSTAILSRPAQEKCNPRARTRGSGKDRGSNG